MRFINSHYVINHVETRLVGVKTAVRRMCGLSLLRYGLSLRAETIYAPQNRAVIVMRRSVLRFYWE